MLLDRLQRPRFAFTFIRRFPLEETRRRFGQFEEAFGAYITPNATVANLPPNAPPDAPRFMLQSGKKQLLVSGTVAQLNLDFSDGIPRGYDLRSSLRKIAVEADKMDTIFGHQEEFYSGVIVTATVPYKDEELVVLADLYKLIHGAEPSEKINAITTSVGVLRSRFNVQTSIGQYKMVEAQGELSLSGPSSIHIDFDFSPSSEDGLEFKWDVNTKPTLKTPSKRQFTAICEILSDHIAAEDGQAWAGMFKQ